MKIHLSKTQFDKLSDISIGLGQLFFGSLVVPYVIPSLDKPPIFVLILGLLLTISLWVFAIHIVKR